jgi:hypothetical protein
MLSSSCGLSKVSPCHDVVVEKKASKADRTITARVAGLAALPRRAQTTKIGGLRPNSPIAALLNRQSARTLVLPDLDIYFFLNRKKHGANYAILLLIGSTRSIITLQVLG